MRTFLVLLVCCSSPPSMPPDAAMPDAATPDAATPDAMLEACTPGVTQCFVTIELTKAEVRARVRLCCDSTSAEVDTWVIQLHQLLGFVTRTVQCGTEYVDAFPTRDPAVRPIIVAGYGYGYNEDNDETRCNATLE